MKRAAAIVFLWGQPAMLGCSSQDSHPSDVGANLNDASGGAINDAGDDGGAGDSVEVGTGRDQYESLADGETVEIVLGPQGGGRVNGYHIWGGLKVVGFQPERARVSFTILDASTRELRASQTRVVTLEPSSDGFVAYGLAPRIMDCCDVEGRSVIMRGEIEDAAGKRGSDERVVRASTCVTGSGAPLCP